MIGFQSRFESERIVSQAVVFWWRLQRLHRLLLLMLIVFWRFLSYLATG